MQSVGANCNNVVIFTKVSYRERNHIPLEGWEDPEWYILKDPVAPNKTTTRL